VSKALLPAGPHLPRQASRALLTFLGDPRVTRFNEWLGALTGITGALLMASNQWFSPAGYPVWLVSSLSLSLFAIGKGYRGILLLQGVFTVINLMGLWQWLVKPLLAG